MSTNGVLGTLLITCITLTWAKSLINEEIIVDIADEMRRAGIVPKIIPKAPNKLLNVFLPNGKLRPGSKLFHDTVKEKPGIIFEANATDWYTLIISVVYNVDPNERIKRRSAGVTTPTYPQEEWHEWICVNIPGNDLFLGEDYFRPQRPHHDTSLEIVNLYLYLLYKQPGKLKFKRPQHQIKPDGNIVKTVNDFVAFYNMTGPLEGNFHYRSWVHPLPDNKVPWYVPPP